MDIKYLVAVVLLAFLTMGGVLVATCSQRARDIMFFFMVAWGAISERMDVHFFSHAWYRGTTTGLEISLVEVLAVSILSATLLAPRYEGARIYWPASFGFMGLYFAYACGSVLISDPQVFGLLELTKLVKGGLFVLTAALFIRSSRELKALVLGLACAAFIEGVLGFKQRLFGGMDRVAGSLDHANSLSMYLCLIGPVLAAAATADFPKWVRRSCFFGLGVAAATMMLTLSRAGVPTFGLMVMATAAWCVSWRITFKKIWMGLAVLAVASCLLYASWKPLMARYAEATLEEEYLEANEGRGVYLRWAKLIVADHFWGLGLNNWSYGVSETYGAKEGFIYGDYDQIHSLEDRLAARDVNFAAPAHSLAALTLGELGIPGLCVFLLLWARWFLMGARFLLKRAADPMHRMGVGILFGMGGVFLQSVTEWVFRHTPIFITFHMLVGALAALCYQKKLQRRAAREQSRASDALPEPAMAGMEAVS